MLATCKGIYPNIDWFKSILNATAITAEICFCSSGSSGFKQPHCFVVRLHISVLRLDYTDWIYTSEKFSRFRSDSWTLCVKAIKNTTLLYLHWSSIKWFQVIALFLQKRSGAHLMIWARLGDLLLYTVFLWHTFANLIFIPTCSQCLSSYMHTKNYLMCSACCPTNYAWKRHVQKI